MDTPDATSPAHGSSGFLGVALLLLCATPAAWAQGKIDARLMQRYGGVLAPTCSNYMLPQLKYLGDSLVARTPLESHVSQREVTPVQAACTTQSRPAALAW